MATTKQSSVGPAARSAIAYVVDDATEDWGWSGKFRGAEAQLEREIERTPSSAELHELYRQLRAFVAAEHKQSVRHDARDNPHEVEAWAADLQTADRLLATVAPKPSGAKKPAKKRKASSERNRKAKAQIKLERERIAKLRGKS